MQAQYQVATANLELFKKAMNKVNNKAAKLNAPSVNYTLSQPYEIIDPTYEGEAQFAPMIEVVDVEVTGEAPTLSGWILCGTLDQMSSEQDNIVKTVPGESIPQQYWTRRICDHCQADRVRRETFVLRNEAGEYIQVGRQCVRDFFNGVDPHALAQYIESLLVVEGGKGWTTVDFAGTPEARRVAPLELLKTTIYMMRNFGWVSRASTQEGGANQGKDTTAAWVIRYEFDYKTWHKEFAKLIRPTDEEFAEAERVLEWAKNLGGNNEYQHNLRVLFNSTSIKGKDIGYAASAVIAYRKAMEQIKTRESEGKVMSKWVGAVGEKIQAQVKVLNKTEIASDFGMSYLIKFVTPEGNKLTWFASTYKAASQFEIDGEYKIKGTIKKLTEFHGNQETMLTRVGIA